MAAMTDVFEVTNGPARVQIKGLGRTMRKLSKAGADAEEMRELMHEIGMLVVNAASPPVKSGRLAGTMRAGRGKTKAVVRAGGARTPYAGVVHYGWPARGIRAQPFFTAALQSQRGAAFKMLDDGIEEILQKNDLI